MLVATNHQFAIPLIPECRLSGLQQWAEFNNLTITNTPNDNVEYVVPYRGSYDRIVRGLAADWHELMIDENIVNLNNSSWAEVSNIALDYINNWIENNSLIPINKHHCHSSYYISYISHKILPCALFFDVSETNALPTYLNSRFGLDLFIDIPKHPSHFYNHTVPYWEIDRLYHSNPKLKSMIDRYCANDTKIIVSKLV